jgi:hypothetical protein
LSRHRSIPVAAPPPLPPSIRWLQSRAVIPAPVSPPNPSVSPFPFLLYAAAPPTINGKLAGRRALSFSLPSLSLSLFKVEPELPISPLHSHHVFTHSSTTYTQRRRPCLRRRWRSSSQVKVPSSLPFFLSDVASGAR